MRLYRYLLRALPRDLRDEFGADMEQLLRDRLEDTESRRARAVLWVGAVVDVVRVAVAARVPRRIAAAPAAVKRPIGDLPMDIRLATRALLRSPTYSIAAVVTLAVGIGTATAFFSVVHAVLLRPLPFRDAERLVTVYHEQLTPEMVDEVRRSRIVESAVPISGGGFGLTAATPGGAVLIRATRVGGSFFQLLGTAAGRGRLLQPADDRADALPVAVVNERFWQEHFSGSPVGRPLTMGGRTYEIVGTLPADFAFLRGSADDAVWLPLEPGDVGRGLLAKLHVGQTVDEARAALQLLADRQPKAAAPQQSGEDAYAVQVSTLYEATFSDLDRRLWIFFGAAVLVLLLAAANVGSLAIGRALARREELAVRAALGAGRFRILRLLVVEASVLGVAAALGGLVIAQLTPALVALAPRYLPRREEIGLDLAVLLFALAAAGATVLVSGVAPALGVSRWAERTSLHAAATRGQRAGVAQSALVIGEVAVALVLTIGALLLVRTYVALRPSEPGFQVEDRVTAAFELPVNAYEFYGDGAALRFGEQLLAGIRALPGEPDAELSTNVPMSMRAKVGRSATPVDATGAQDTYVLFSTVSPDYLDLMEMPLVTGRGLLASDRVGAPRVGVINETAARRLWNTTAVVGRRLRVHDEENEEQIEIVGVVRDARFLYLPEARPEVFVPFAQLPLSHFSVVIESTRQRPMTMREVRDVVNAIDRQVPILDFKTLREEIGSIVAEPRFQATLLTLLTIIGIVLAATGCFAVLMQNAGRRTREFGVRMTLGATARTVAWLILGRALALAAIGTVIGIGIAAAATRLLASQLFGVQPTDVPTFIVAAVVLAVVIAAAALVPARRVAKLDPVQALRHP